MNGWWYYCIWGQGWVEYCEKVKVNYFNSGLYCSLLKVVLKLVGFFLRKLNMLVSMFIIFRWNSESPFADCFQYLSNICICFQMFPKSNDIWIVLTSLLRCMVRGTYVLYHIHVHNFHLTLLHILGAVR